MSMKNVTFLSNLFNEAVKVQEDLRTTYRFNKLTLEVLPNNAFHGNKPLQRLEISLEDDNDNIAQLYDLILDAELSEIKEFIKEEPEINLNFNIREFDKNNGDKRYSTPLAVAIWYTFWTGEAVENVIYLLDKGAKEGEGISQFISNLEDYRLDSNTDDFEAWEIIKDTFDIDSALSVDDAIDKENKEKEEKKTEDKEALKDTKKVNESKNLETDAWEIIPITNFDEANKICKDTKWDFGKSKEEFEEAKSRHGDIFVIVNKIDPEEKYTFCSKYGEVYDSVDSKIPTGYLNDIFSNELMDIVDNILSSYSQDNRDEQD